MNPKYRSTKATGDDVLDYVHSLFRCASRYSNIVYYTPETESDMLRMDLREGISKKIHLFNSDDYFEEHCTILDMFYMFKLRIIVPDNALHAYKNSVWSVCDYEIIPKSKQNSIKVKQPIKNAQIHTTRYVIGLTTFGNKIASFLKSDIDMNRSIVRNIVIGNIHIQFSCENDDRSVTEYALLFRR
jgi:hypothetical protein